jgi:hypothetical protein
MLIIIENQFYISFFQKPGVKIAITVKSSSLPGSINTDKRIFVASANPLYVFVEPTNPNPAPIVTNYRKYKLSENLFLTFRGNKRYNISR